MPEEPQNTDRHIDPVEQWGETEPSTQPFATPFVSSEPSPVEPVESSEASAVVSDDSYSAYEEPQTIDQQPEVTPDWGEIEPSTQSNAEPSDSIETPLESSDETSADFPSEGYSEPVDQHPATTTAWGESEPAVESETTSEVTPEVAPESIPVEPTSFAPEVLPVDLAAGQAPVVATTPQKSKKPLIIGIILVALFVLLGGGGVLAYNLWYQNPEKVVTDALINAATARSSVYVGTIKTEDSGTKATIDVTVKQSGATSSLDAKVTLNIAGKDYSVSGSTLVDQTGDLYLKVEQLQSIVNEYKTQLGSMVDASQFAAIDKLVAKIDGNWIKISSADLKEVSGTTATAKTCINDAVTKFKDDKAAIAEVTDLYKKHQFIVVDKKLGDKDGSLGYVIKGDSAITKAFAEGLKDTKIYKTLHDCDSTFTIDTSNFDTSNSASADNGTVELWVSRWSHQITKLSISSVSNGTTSTGVITPTFNQPVEIKTPATSTTLKKLQADIEAFLQGFSSVDTSSTVSSADVSSVQMYAESYASNNRGAYPTVAQLMPSLPISIQSKVSAVTPSEGNSGGIGYVFCGTRGADITYYDTMTKSVQHSKIGNCV